MANTVADIVVATLKAAGVQRMYGLQYRRVPRDPAWGIWW